MNSPAAWRRALVTGASSGIGEAFARRLAADGVSLVLVARREPLLCRLRDELAARHSIDVEVLPADLTDDSQRAAVADRLLSDVAPIDLLVNNAGGGTVAARFVDHDCSHVTDVAMLNAMAVHELTHAATSRMVRTGRGHVIQVSAGAALYPVPGGATYAASKAFVNSFTEAVNRELAGTGVRLTIVCPGFTRTAASARVGFDETNVPRFLWSDPEDVVDAALRAVRRRRAVTFPTSWDRAAAVVLRHLPRGFVAAVTARVTRARLVANPASMGGGPSAVVASAPDTSTGSVGGSGRS